MAQTPPAPRLTPTIYTQPGCIFCGAAMQWLNEQGIPFIERDITKDPVAREELDRMGLHATPAIVIDGQVILGFDAKVLEAALVQKVRPRREARQAGSTDQGP